MKVLEKIRQILISTWILPTPETEKQWIIIRNFLFGCWCMLIGFAAALSSIIFIVKFIHGNLEDLLYALLQIATAGSEAYLCLLAFFLRKKFDEMFAKLQEVYDTCKQFRNKARFIYFFLIH